MINSPISCKATDKIVCFFWRFPSYINLHCAYRLMTATPNQPKVSVKVPKASSSCVMRNYLYQDQFVRQQFISLFFKGNVSNADDMLIPELQTFSAKEILY